MSWSRVRISKTDNLLPLAGRFDWPEVFWVRESYFYARISNQSYACIWISNVHAWCQKKKIFIDDFEFRISKNSLHQHFTSHLNFTFEQIIKSLRSERKDAYLNLNVFRCDLLLLLLGILLFGRRSIPQDTAISEFEMAKIKICKQFYHMMWSIWPGNLKEQYCAAPLEGNLSISMSTH
jgi:hypothetical protein